MKKLLSLLLALLFVITAAAGTAVTAADTTLPFKDVKSKNWFYSAVDYVYTNGIMNGTSQTKFEPQTHVTRAMFVAMLGRLHGAEETATTFKDIPSKNSGWYAGYVGWASDNGIITGFPDNTFRPNENLTREQMATILSRYIAYAGILPTVSTDPTDYFRDEESIGKWAREFVDAMRVIGIVEGDELGNFKPSANLTRAEAATTVKRLDEMLKKLAFEDAKSLDFTVDSNTALMGAWDLYYAGTALDSSYSGVKVEAGAAYPYLTKDSTGQLFINGNYRFGEDFETTDDPNPLLEGNYFEIDLRIANISPAKYPILRFAYRIADGSKPTLALYGSVTEKVDFNEQDESENGWKYGIIDLSSLSVGDSCTVALMTESDIELMYLAAFSDTAHATAFAAAEHAKQLSSYDGDVVAIKPADSAELDRVLSEAGKAADAIISSESDVTPDSIKGKAYYISSKNGNDSNSGTSPDKPWKSFKNLWVSLAGGMVINSALEAGDGVFLERGCEFNLNSDVKLDYLSLVRGISYGAYGEGEKPVLTRKLQMNEAAGKWSATEYPNVWKLDYDIKDAPGNISFVKKDGTELWGVMTFVDDYDTPFTGSTKHYGIVSNGEETFESGGVKFENVGALKHNLEYFGDCANGGLYVYYDKGNPGEIFSEINISLSASAVTYAEKINRDTTSPTRFDNIAIKYCGAHGLDLGGVTNLIVTNCVFEWIGGAYQSKIVRYGNAIQNWGSCDGFIVRDCYFKDIYDAAVTTQGSSGVMRNFYSSGCVLDRCGLSFEFFNHAAPEFDSLYPTPELCNVFITDNYVINNGFGYCDVRTDRRAAFIYTAYGVTRAKYDNVVYSGNINVFSAEYAVYTSMLACGKTEGTQLRDNTYYMDSDSAVYGKLIYNIADRTGDNVLYPYTSQYLTYLRSIGIEEGSTFYSVKNPDIDGKR